MKTLNSEMAITPLEAWIRSRTGSGPGPAGKSFTRALESYQLNKMNETIMYARRHAPFYRRRLAALPDPPLTSLADIARIPFTTPSELGSDPGGFLAVRQDDVARIVTLSTSGSTGEAKRVFFTQEDLERTMDFFHHGMSTLVAPGQRVMVLLPSERPDSVGDLLVRGLRRMNVGTLAYGPVIDPRHAAETLAAFKAHCLVGIPTQVLALARQNIGAAKRKWNVRSVLLSTDYCPRAIAKRLETQWGCRVFTHYGMTEMGLGGGVECAALHGYHLREEDLYFEVVDPTTGQACPEGMIGEVVFTTLTRRGMPLIRYRTGDIARMLPGACPCGSVLRRMGRVRGRWGGTVRLGPGCALNLPDMDEALFQLEGLLDYRVTLSKGQDDKWQLLVTVHAEADERPGESEVFAALEKIDAVRTGVAAALLKSPEVRFSPSGRWATTGAGKRSIIVTEGPPRSGL